MTDEEYFSSPAVSSSDLKNFMISPGHYKYYKQFQKDETPAMRLGKMFHRFLLEPERAKTIVVSPVFDRRTKIGKEGYAEFIDSLPSEAEIITSEDNEKIQTMLERVNDTPKARELLSHGESEVCVFWNEDGLECRAKMDYVRNDAIIDVKTTVFAGNFESRALANKHHIQASHYLAGTDKQEFVFVVVETSPIFGVRIIKAKPKFLLKGFDKRIELMAKFKRCSTDNYWPTYAGGETEEMDLPDWADNYDEAFEEIE